MKVMFKEFRGTKSEQGFVTVVGTHTAACIHRVLQEFASNKAVMDEVKDEIRRELHRRLYGDTLQDLDMLGEMVGNLLMTVDAGNLRKVSDINKKLQDALEKIKRKLNEEGS